MNKPFFIWLSIDYLGSVDFQFEKIVFSE